MDMSVLEGIFSISGALILSFLGWCFWELVFWLISFIPVSIVFN